MLWLLVLTLFIFLFLIKTKNQPIKYKILTLVFQQVIIIGFFVFLIKTSNPFNYLYPIPEEGLGLNPILQDPALAIHPPILYLGYVGSSIIFSSALAATSLNMISKKWASHIKKWVLISWVFLTLGILLGSIWAYYELGWGGFWFWDPVENVSLMPWLALTTLLHCVLVLEKKLVLTSWVVAKTLQAHTDLVAQLQARTVRREYEAVVLGGVISGGVVDQPIGRNSRQRTKMAVISDGKNARTHYKILSQFEGYTHLRLKLETGRTQ